MPICSASAFASCEHAVAGVGEGLGILAISKLFLRGTTLGGVEAVDCDKALGDCDCDCDCACAAMAKARQHSDADAVLMPLSIIKRELVFPKNRPAALMLKPRQ